MRVPKFYLTADSVRQKKAHKGKAHDYDDYFWTLWVNIIQQAF